MTNIKVHSTLLIYNCCGTHPHCVTAAWTKDSNLLKKKHSYKKVSCLLIATLPRFLRRFHLPDYIIYPAAMCTPYKECERITIVKQLLASPIAQGLADWPKLSQILLQDRLSEPYHQRRKLADWQILPVFSAPAKYLSCLA